MHSARSVLNKNLSMPEHLLHESTRADAVSPQMIWDELIERKYAFDVNYIEIFLHYKFSVFLGPEQGWHNIFKFHFTHQYQTIL